MEIEKCACGGVAKLRTGQFVLIGNREFSENASVVICEKCGLQTASYDAGNGAVALWNAAQKAINERIHQIGMAG